MMHGTKWTWSKFGWWHTGVYIILSLEACEFALFFFERLGFADLRSVYSSWGVRFRFYWWRFPSDWVDLPGV